MVVPEEYRGGWNAHDNQDGGRMSAEDPYFQFPLCALAFGDDEHKRLNHIISYSIVEAGRVAWARFSDEEKKEKRGEFKGKGKAPRDWQIHEDDHMAAVLGAEACHVTIRGINHSLSEHKALSKFIDEFERKYGRDATVRIKAKYVWEVLGGAGLNYEELSYLCAIYSCIGANHGPVRIVRESIRARSLGYKSPKQIALENEGRELPTEWRVRSMVDKLHSLKFFSRCHPSPRQTFFSNKLDDEELRTAVIKRKTYLAEFKAEHRGRDTKLSDYIKARLKPSTIIAEKTTTIIAPSPETAKQPPTGHQATSNEPPSDHHYNKNTLNRNSVIETQEIKTQEILTASPLAVSLSDSDLKPAGKPEPKPEPELQMPDREVIAIYALQAVKDSAPYVGEFYDLLTAGKVKGDWKKAFVRFAMNCKQAAKRLEKMEALKA